MSAHDPSRVNRPAAHHPAAEIQQLAHTLGVPPARLDALRDVPPADLRTLRFQVAEYLFRVDKHQFAQVAALAQAVPAPVAAKLAELVLPPLLAARTTELIKPQRALELVGRMSDSYLADVSAALDPSRCPEVIAQSPADRVATVGRELARREEWVVMGRFVTHVGSAALDAMISQLTGEQLLRIGFVLPDPSRLDEIVTLLSDAQLDAVLIAANERDLWRELDELLTNVTGLRRARLAERLAAAPASLAQTVQAAVERGALSRDALAALTSP